MELREYHKDAIESLKQHEKAIGRLYETFAKKIPSQIAFWHELALEEESHAAWIETISSKMKADLMDFSEFRFQLDAIKESTDYLSKKDKEYQTKEFAHIEALNTAVVVERGMLENKFFEIFRDDSPELQILMDALRLSTEKHLAEVQEALNTENESMQK